MLIKKRFFLNLIVNMVSSLLAMPHSWLDADIRPFSGSSGKFGASETRYAGAPVTSSTVRLAIGLDGEL